MTSVWNAPGVYVEEAGSMARGIDAVPTDIAAFVGTTTRGPSHQPVAITSQGDFERTFGTTVSNLPLGDAVSDFFGNGGSRAVVVRLFAAPVGTSGRARIDADGLVLEASSAGAWGNALRVRVERPDPMQLGDAFDLLVYDGSTGTIEAFRSVTVAEGPRRIDRVLTADSELVAVGGSAPLPAPGAPAAHLGASTDVDVWTDDGKSTGVTSAGADSLPLTVEDAIGEATPGTGLFALARAEVFNVLVLASDDRSRDVPPAVYRAALDVCAERRAMLLVDPPRSWLTVADAQAGLGDLGLTGAHAANAAMYFPAVRRLNPATGVVESYPPSGTMAGVISRVDRARGCWKAPAGPGAALHVEGFAVALDDPDSRDLASVAINSLRAFPGLGRVAWGARTLRGVAGSTDPYRYLAVRRLALCIEASLQRGLQWTVFEPNAEPLWATVRFAVGAFMESLFRQGAFVGSTAREAYVVRCDRSTNTDGDIAAGRCNLIVGFAPLRPAEFVIITQQQAAGVP